MFFFVALNFLPLATVSHFDGKKVDEGNKFHFGELFRFLYETLAKRNDCGIIIIFTFYVKFSQLVGCYF